MVRKRLPVWPRVLLAAVLLAVLAAGCSAPRSAPSPLSSPSAVPQGAPQESIKVHGRWTIEVRNPDGSLVSRNEFDNALTPIGRSTLSMVLGRLDSVGGWRIFLGASPATDTPFKDASSNPWSPGWITESTDPTLHPFAFKTLTVSVPTSGTNQDKLVLSGTATAQRDGRITYVATSLQALNPSQPPSSSYAGSSSTITSTDLAADKVVNLAFGQQVAVTVVISFS